MGKYQRNKGARAERELVNLLKGAGFEAKRISMMETGGVDKGDVLWEDLLCEVKIGGQVPKFIYDAIKTEEIDLLVLRRDREKWKVVCDLDMFMDIMDILCLYRGQENE